MINQKKIELMTQMAMYEKTRKAAVKLNRNFERYHKFGIALRSIPVGLAIGVLVSALALAALYSNDGTQSPWLFAEIYNVSGLAPAIALGLVFVFIVCGVYVWISVLILSGKFENTRGSYVKYRLCRQELLKINDEESSV